MAHINLPSATAVENTLHWRLDTTRHQRANFVIDYRYDGLWLEDVTVRHAGFCDPQPGYDPRALFVDLDGADFSEEDVLALEQFLPRGYTIHWKDERAILSIVRHSDPALDMIPLHMVPEDERGQWDSTADYALRHNWASGVHVWNPIIIKLAGGDPDMTLDVRMLDHRARLDIDRRFGNADTAWDWRRLGGVYCALEDEFRHIEPRALQTELDDPGRVWVSVLAMARCGVWPGVAMPQETNNLSLGRRVMGRRSDWQRYGSTTGRQIEKLFTYNTLVENGQNDRRGQRALVIEDSNPAWQRCTWPETDLTPAPVHDGEVSYPGFRLPVLGVKPGATGFTRYRPDRVWTHFRGYDRNALNWGGDRVFVHRGRDAWRFLFAFEDTLAYSSGSEPFPMLYCIPVIVQNSEVDLRRTVTFRGMPLDLQEAIWAVPGMSMALTHALNTVRFQHAKRIPLLRWRDDRFPKNHFAVGLGSVRRTVLGSAAVDLFRQKVSKPPFRATYGPMAGIADVFIHLFRLAGPCSIVADPVQRVAKSGQESGLARRLELGGVDWERDAALTGQIMTRYLDL